MSLSRPRIFGALAALALLTGAVAGCAAPDAGAGADSAASESQTLRVGAVTSPATDIVEAAAEQIGNG